MNPDIGILSVGDTSFRRFGEVHEGFRVDSLLGYLDQEVKVGNAIVYEPDAVGMGRFPEETLPLQRVVFGGATDLQAGLAVRQERFPGRPGVPQVRRGRWWRAPT